MSMPRAKSQTRRKQPAYALIKDALAKRIRTGDVPSGTVLSESSIANLFGSSRSPVRQAFDQLELIGLVRRFDGRGVVAGKRQVKPRRIPITPQMLGLTDGPVEAVRSDTWDALYYRLERDIIYRSLFGRFRVSELALARHFRVGRTVARNLLLRAQAIGILEKGAKAHWYVVPLDQERVRNIFEVRATLEPLLLKSAAARIPAPLLDEMAERLREAIHFRNRIGVGELDEIEGDLHIRCLGYGVNREMFEALKRTHCAFVIGKHIQVALTAPQIDSFMDEHLLIMDALRARDGDAAAATLRRHIEWSHSKVAGWIAEFRAINVISHVPYMV
ncbi:GntR family transcriptional regulator [Bradyrhizobium jicamae]|uniref:GntR family transcriptional regulator n=1 Tax=Bradyrhizobium jicamae TaxID=280332 RepID=A0ABS5FCX9_9BRAD|nr:GntR family transcriptional regulator [Bradyrhizobium jicamae]MBR0794646.1 GntR family transcriptional regulator [Bradyrhizobium jicamae]MBR0934507.1 GntR family transcriptional regulator [Bradyrhizobium jicamae]